MSDSYDSLFRIIKDPHKKILFPKKEKETILLKPKKRKFTFPKFPHISKRQKYLEILAIIMSVISYLLYYLSLGGCDGTQTECLKNSNIAYYYILVDFCFISAGLICLINYLIISKIISKYHLIHQIIVFSFLFLSDTGSSLMKHGLYNIIGFALFVIFYTIFLFMVTVIRELLYKKSLPIILIVINTIILLIIFARFLVHNAFKNECKDWDLGLNNTRIQDDINKYPCQIKRPISCHLNFFNNKQDLSKLLKLKCSNNVNSNQVINSRKLLIKYINRTELEKTKRFGFPLTNNDKFKINPDITPESFTKKVFDNIIDMDAPPNNLKPEEYPEITLNFNEIGDDYKNGDKSMKYMGKININITKNEKLSIERKGREIPNSLFNNVLMIYTDAVSRVHFKRKMPKTCAFIEKFMKNNFENDYFNILNDIAKNNVQNNLINANNNNDIKIPKVRELSIKKKIKHHRKTQIRTIIKKKTQQPNKIKELQNHATNSISLNNISQNINNTINNSIIFINKNPIYGNNTNVINNTNDNNTIINNKNINNPNVNNINFNNTITNNIYNSNINVYQTNVNNNNFNYTNGNDTNNNNTNFSNANDNSTIFNNINFNNTDINKTNLNVNYTNVNSTDVGSINVNNTNINNTNVNNTNVNNINANPININNINVNNTNYNNTKQEMSNGFNNNNIINSTKNINQNEKNFNNLRNTNYLNYLNDKYYAYQFLKYHTFTSGTKFNAMPMFFGQSVYSLIATNIIKYFKILGYITAQSVDMCSKEVWEPELEPSRLDFDFWDHENVAMFCDPSYMDRKSLYSIYKGVYSLLRRCFYGKEVHDYIIEYGTKFWEAYPDNKKFLRLGFNDGHESTFEVLQYLDEPLYNFLETFYQKGYLKNTALIIVSDHGNHMPGIYNLFFSEQFEIERVLGNLFIIINSDRLFNEQRDVFKIFNENIMENQQSIVTPYDIYNTLVHIIYGNVPNTLYTRRGTSFFFKMNNSVRNCQFFDKDNEEEGLCKCVPNEKYEKFVYYNKSK